MMMVGSLEEAAHDAAIEDGVLSGYGGGRSDDLFKSKKAGLRRGKWTTEEEAYANRLIYEFKLGLLPLTDGTTLRTFLSKLLNCDPMRISKKFVGQNCIGKVNLKLPLFIQFLIISIHNHNKKASLLVIVRSLRIVIVLIHKSPVALFNETLVAKDVNCLMWKNVLHNTTNSSLRGCVIHTISAH